MLRDGDSYSPGHGIKTNTVRSRLERERAHELAILHERSIGDEAIAAEQLSAFPTAEPCNTPV